MGFWVMVDFLVFEFLSDVRACDWFFAMTTADKEMNGFPLWKIIHLFLHPLWS
jgi:hypothetical protein